MPGCAAFDCKNRDGPFFRFPQGERNAKRLKAWLHNVGRVAFNHRTARLCQKHFANDQFENHCADGKVKLKPNAVPTLFSHRPKTPSRKPPRKRFRSPSLEEENVQENPGGTHDQKDACCQTDISIPNDLARQIHVCVSTPVDAMAQTNISSTQDLDLHKKIAELQRIIDLQRKRIQKAEELLERTENKVKGFFNEDQLKLLRREGAKGTFCWSDITLQKAIKFRLSCGSVGYNVLRELGMPLPSERTIRRRLETFKFEPGILTELYSSLELKVSFMSFHEKVAILMIDEIALAPGIDIDAMSGCIIGYPTLPTAHGKMCDKPACHALVFMLGGLTSRWKQVIAYHFTGDSYDATSVKTLIEEVIQECARIGIRIVCVVSDMGGHNQSLWRKCGIVAGRHSKVINFCPHPCDPTEKLFFMPDVPHVFKNIRNHLTNNQNIFIPDNFVEENSLPTNCVTISHVIELFKVSDQLDLKLAPLVRESSLKPNHYEKMKVGLALALINQTTAAALRTAVELKKLPSTALTTAWFFDQLHTWFKLMTSQHVNMAMKAGDACEDDNTVTKTADFLHKFKKLFEGLQIGDIKHWKPVQSGVLLAVTTALDLLKHYCQDNGNKFILLSRLTQDALENLFSTIRSTGNPVPRCKEFKCSLKLITLSQFFRPSTSGSYLHSDAEYLTDFVTEHTKPVQDADHNEDSYLENETVPDNVLVSCPQDIENSETSILLLGGSSSKEGQIGMLEKQSLYYLAGEVALKLKKKYKLCNECKSFLVSNNTCDSALQEVQRFTQKKEFTLDRNEEHLTYASEEVYKLCLRAEEHIRTHKTEILSGKFGTNDLLKLCEAEKWCKIRMCHDLTKRLIEQYFRTRVFFIIRKINTDLQGERNAKCSSRSIGMHNAVK